MFEILLVEKVCSIGMFIFFIISMGILLFLEMKYKRLIKEAENMSITKRKELKAIKTKFLNSYGDKGREDNINAEVFVDKAVTRLKIGGLKPNIWRFFSNQSIICSIIFAGVGIFRSITSGMSIRQISPFYLIAFLELYIYFSVISIFDYEEKERILKLTIIEYIDNHLINRVRIANDFEIEENVIRILEEEQNKKKVFSKEMEQELDSLLQEFLV